MALPPEPLDELLASVEVALTGRVVAIVDAGPEEPSVPRPEGWTGAIDDSPWQVVEIERGELLRGSAPARLGAFKPRGPYSLAVGDATGVFLLGPAQPDSRGLPVIVGRYGPFGYELDEVRAALRDGQLGGAQ